MSTTGNDQLRAALQHAGLQPDDLAEIVEVDVKTVRRWLGGMAPYPRHRGRVARALDTTEHALWPQLATTPPEPPAATVSPPISDLIAGYPTTNDPAAPDCQTLMREASDRIELLDETLIHILDIDAIPKLLATKATDGCQIRMLYSSPANHWVNHREGIDRRSDPDVNAQQEAENDQAADARALAWEHASDRTHELLEPLIGRPRIEIREYVAARFNTILRFDEQMLVTLHLWAQPTIQAPLLHLQRRSDSGLFDRFAAHYDALWHDASTPVQAAKQPDRQPAREPTAVSDVAAAEPRRDVPSPTEAPHDPARPRRWPGREQ